MSARAPAGVSSQEAASSTAQMFRRVPTSGPHATEQTKKAAKRAAGNHQQTADLKESLSNLRTELRITQRSLAARAIEVSDLKAQLAATEASLARARGQKSISADVYQPTIPEMEKMLKRLEPTKEKLTQLRLEINTLSNNASTDCDPNNKTSIDSLQAALGATKEDGYRAAFIKLSNRYTKLLSKVEDAIHELNETYKKTKRDPISNHHLETISSQNLIGMDEMRANTKSYEDLRVKISDMEKNLTNGLKNTRDSFAETAYTLNRMQRRIEYDTGAINYLSYKSGTQNTIVAVWPPESKEDAPKA